MNNVTAIVSWYNQIKILEFIYDYESDTEMIVRVSKSAKKIINLGNNFIASSAFVRENNKIMLTSLLFYYNSKPNT